MAAPFVTIPGLDASRNQISLLFSTDGNAVYPGHFLVNSIGNEVATQGSPLYTASAPLTLISRTLSGITANTSTNLAPQNNLRRIFIMQTPQTVAVWINL